MDKISALLERWGRWAASYRPWEIKGITAEYERVSRQSYDGDDDVAMLIDRAVAAMPESMAKVKKAIKTRYLYNRGQYEGSKFLNINEKTYYQYVQQGQAWVYGYVMAYGAAVAPEIYLLISDKKRD